MKKYMFIVPSLSSGGAERAVVNLSSQLAIDGEDVTVVIYFRMPDEYKVQDKVKIINLSGDEEATYNRIAYLKKIWMLRKILKKQKPDYVLPFLPQVTIHAAIAGFDMHNKIIHTLRNNPAVTPPNKIKRYLCNKITCKSWKTIVQNEKQRSYYPEKYQKKMHVLFNPVSNELININKHYKDTIRTIIAVGRLDEQKNFEMLIRAMKKSLDVHRDIQLKIYGEGQLRTSLQHLIDENKLQESVFLMGRSSDMLTVYHNADMFILSSNYEGMPNTLIEAMAVGLPCIATDCETGPADLIITNENGILFPVGREERLVEAINQLIENPFEAIAMGKKAKITVCEKCGIESITSQLRDICEA